jgi:pimeloyl-ACP methyl ester carboxylesterase
MKTSTVHRLFVRETGTDVPVLLLHHGLGTSEFYADPEPGNVAQWIAARGCRVLAPDLPGHGLSEPVTEFGDDFADYVSHELAALLDERGIRRVGSVIGVGFGGLAALHFAARYPGRVASIVADSPPGLLKDRERCGYEPWPMLGPEHVERPDMERFNSWEIFVDRQRSIDPYAGLRGTIPCPTLMLFGGEAGSPSAAKVYETAKTLPAEVALLPAEAPPCCWHAPSYFMREVESFLAAHA